MKNLNYALTGGNKTLMRAQALNSTTLFQLWYANIVLTTVTVEVWISTVATGPYSRIDAATKTIVPADNTGIISLTGLSFAFVEFRLVSPVGTAGTITNIDIMGAVNPSY